MRAEHLARLIDDWTGLEGLPGVFLDERYVVAIGNEADILAFQLVGVHEPGFVGHFSHLRLAQLAHGKQHVRQLALR